MARLHKTSVYLTQRERAALTRAARLTGRSQSDLIREAVRRLAYSFPPPPRASLPRPNPNLPTREESLTMGLLRMNYSPAQIAREFRMTEAEALPMIARARAFLED